MSLNVLIIGYGSIGKRHAQVLCDYFGADITLISQQDSLPYPHYTDISSLPSLESFDYYIIASPTHTHFAYLQKLDSILSHKTIFVEKPLFDMPHDFTPSGKNHIAIGFCLRFHPLFARVREFISDSKPYFVQINCGSYLPSWREGVDYRTLYSAHKEQGGGVALDLSHELDYTQWLFGKINLHSLLGFNGKISELEISSDDTLCLLAKTHDGTLVHLALNYFSKIPTRQLSIHTPTHTLHLDLISNTLVINDLHGNQKQENCDFQRNELFASMHKSLLNYPLQKSLSPSLQTNQIAHLPNFEQNIALTSLLARIKNMKPKQNILCVIGCRGGSQGVKNKNITPIAGKPLLAYTILQALQSKLFAHIVLSTDSQAIANVGKQWGAEVFFLRDKELATDSAGKLPVIRDALLRSEAHFNTHYDVIFDLDATAPLRLVSDITQAYDQFIRDDNDILITAAPARKSPYFNLVEVFQKDGKKRIALSKQPAQPILRRQDSPKCYDMNASIYIWKREALLENESVFVPNTGLFIMPEERSVDIDTPLDFAFVEFMLTRAQSHSLDSTQEQNNLVSEAVSGGGAALNLRRKPKPSYHPYIFLIHNSLFLSQNSRFTYSFYPAKYTTSGSKNTYINSFIKVA